MSGDLLPIIDLSPSKDGSIIKKILKEGTGDEYPNTGDRVDVHYVGKLESDGSIFDSSRERGETFQFTLGKGEVIKGWDIGVKSMKRGELAELTLKAEFAYGATGSPPKIPPNSTLIFEIELFDWQLEDLTKKKDGGVRRSIIREGEGYSTPNEGATVKVTLVGKYGPEQQVFDGERDVCFIIGEGSEEGLVEGLDIAVSKMKKGEKSQIFIRKNYAFKDGKKPEVIPANYEEVVYEVTLNEFEKQKEVWEMGQDERLEQAQLAKCKGTQYFKQGKYDLALKQYKRIARYLGPPENTTASDGEERKSVLLTGYLNLAMTYLKLNRFSDAIKSSNDALEMDPTSEKGLFRRGVAYLSLRDFEAAKKDFTRVLELDASNSAARSKLNECLLAIKEFERKEKETYKNMFEVFARRDKEKEDRAAQNVWKELKDEKKRDFQSNNG